MLTLYSAAVGTALGFLTGLGVGGGSLLMLWLTFGAGLDQQTARGINLVFFLPAAIAGCFFRWRQGAVDIRAIWPAIVSGCAAAAVGSWVGCRLDLTLLKKLFGGLLLLTGVRELLYRPKN